MPEESRMRRQPKQVRSKQRVNHLLDVAEQTFAEIGYANATTNTIAARAGISIASLYQFFPNKEAMMEALVRRYLDELQQVSFISGEDLPITVLIGRGIDWLHQFHDTHAGFRALFLDTDIEHRIDDVIIQAFEPVIVRKIPTLNAALCRQTVVVWLGITKGIMKLTELPNNMLESTAREEVKLALFGYLREVLVRAGVSPPDDLRRT
jgi:AcrR family transcriptional regulator